MQIPYSVLATSGETHSCMENKATCHADRALGGLAFLADNNNNDNNLQVSCYSPLDVCGVVDVVDVVGVGSGVGVGVVCSFVVVILVMLVLVWLLSL